MINATYPIRWMRRFLIWDCRPKMSPPPAYKGTNLQKKKHFIQWKEITFKCQLDQNCNWMLVKSALRCIRIMQMEWIKPVGIWLVLKCMFVMPFGFWLQCQRTSSMATHTVCDIVYTSQKYLYPRIKLNQIICFIPIISHQ